MHRSIGACVTLIFCEDLIFFVKGLSELLIELLNEVVSELLIELLIELLNEVVNEMVNEDVEQLVNEGARTIFKGRDARALSTRQKCKQCRSCTGASRCLGFWR